MTLETSTSAAAVDADSTPALETRGLEVSFGHVRVLHGIDLVVPARGTVGLVGESGSGKSTLGKTAVGINRPSSGHIHVHGKDVTRMGRRERETMRREVQYIPQDPFSSLSPRRTIGQTLAEALDPRQADPRAVRDRLVDALEQVRLTGDALDKYPHQFSGGQRQRIAIARALVLEPRLIIADEITSALDVSVQADILRLLRGLTTRMESSMLFISHNLAVVQSLCTHVVVMYRGEIVEQGMVDDVYRNPQHDYTHRLLAAVPGSPGFTLD